MNDEFSNLVYSSYLSHHGIKGQKWGVRRYQNLDGSLTDAGRRRQERLIGSNRKVTIAKGTTFYRLSDNSKSDTSKDKIFVSASKKQQDVYTQSLGAIKIYNNGKAYAHEYIAKNDIKLPDKKTMEKIELGLLNDKEIQKEIVNSLIKKEYPRDVAIKEARAYSKGKSFAQKIGNVAFGVSTGFMLGGIAGASVGAYNGAKKESKEKRRVLENVRASYGDKDSKLLNEKVRQELNKRGYNGMRDYNAIRAHGKEGKHAVVIFDSDQNIKLKSAKKITSKDYAESYARNYMRTYPTTQLDYKDLVKDGEQKYKELYETGKIDRSNSNKQKHKKQKD